MDPFESNEPIKFTSFLRTRLRQQRSGLPLTQNTTNLVCDRATQLKTVSKRNLEIKKMYEMSLQGIVLDPNNFEPEVTLVQRCRLSTNEQLRHQYEELALQARPLTVRHERTSTDLTLGRVLKFCLFYTNVKKVSPPQLDKDYYQFKQDLEKDIKNEEKRGDLLMACRQINHKATEIMATPLHPDALEAKGFKYNPTTFSDLFGTGWTATFSKENEAESETSEEEMKEAEKQPVENGFGEAILTGEAKYEQELDSADGQSSGAELEGEEEVNVVQQPEFDINMIEPSKVNWFKYIIDKYLQAPEDGTPNLLNSTDAYANLLSILLSPKKNEEISEELLDLVGFHNFELLQQLLEKREFIKDYCKICEEHLQKEKAGDNYRSSYMDTAPNKQAFFVEHTVEVKRKGGKKKAIKEAALYENQRISNYDLLQKLGFDKHLIAENRRLGLKERDMTNDFQKYLAQHKRDLLDPNVTIEQPAAQVYKNAPGAVGKSKEYVEENDDWKFVSIQPPPKAEISKANLVPISTLPLFAQKAFKSATHLNQIQSIVFKTAFKEARNVLVAAPTGAGKTNIALLTILREVSMHIPDAMKQTDVSKFDVKEKRFQIIYIAPLKALASEIVDKFQTALGYLGMQVRELTGDMSMTKQEIAETHIIVSTPEKWDVVTRKTDGLMNAVNCMIIDEIHLLNDERGLVLECLVARALTTGLKNQKPIRIVGLSATLPNYMDVAEFIGCDAEGIFAFDASYRPTPLKCSFYGIKELGNAQRGNNIMNDLILDDLTRVLKMGKQCIIFVHQRGATYNTAKELIELLRLRPKQMHLFEIENKNAVRREVSKSRNDQVKELFEFGFSVHHAGMLRKDRNMVESLFHNGDIKVLCSTSTLAWGVNLPAYCVIIKGTKIYDSSAGAYKDLGVFDVQQIFGRAGRPQFDKEGEAIILTPMKQMDDYVRMLQNRQTIESHLDKGLVNCINAEIAAGTISTVSEGVQWLKKTYLYQRFTKNPHAYGISVLDLQMDPSGHMVLLNKVTEAAEKLNRARLIRYNKQTEQVYSTDMGRIASNYYIDVETMSYFMANLRPTTRDAMLLYHLAQASEFKQLDARKEEYEELKVLVAESSIVEVDKALFNEAHTKVLVLFEAYLKQRVVKTFSLISDMAYVVNNAARLLRAMFEIALKKNFAGLLKSTLQWCQILDKRLVPGRHILRHFTKDASVGKLTNQNAKTSNFGYLKDEIVYRIEQFDISMEALYEKKLDEAQFYIPPTAQDELFKFVSHVPYLEMEVDCQPITRNILKVVLNITATFNWSDRWNGKSEPFWLIVDNETEVLHQEYFLLWKKDVKQSFQKLTGIKNEDCIQITFFLPYEVPQGQDRIAEGNYYSCQLVSDRWYNLDFFVPIQLSEIAVPAEDYPHTKLLPLRPMGIAALNDPHFEKLYESKFSFFNPIQTQVFHTLFHTDSNVLIGAPTGSGKTIMAEFAILRVFKNNPKKKVIYIAPLKALARERIIDWKVRMGGDPMRKSILELTGDYTPDLAALKDADLLITTPEKWDGISRNWQHRSYVSDVALVIIDEIHLLGQDRGPVIEVIVSRMRYIAEQTGNKVRFVGLSTALANAKDVADWLGIHKLGLFNFKPSVRPVPIKVFFEGFAEKNYCPRMATMNRPSFKAILTHSRENPVLVFVSSRRQTRLTALDLIALSAADQQERIMNEGGNGFLDFKKPFLHMDSEEISLLSEYIIDENLKHTIQFGVGMHHAGLAESDRKLVEELFVKKKIQILVTTSTLAWGVNFPARLVVIKGTEFFDPKVKRYIDFPLTDLLQMIGRAGRPGFDDHGIACVMVSEEKKNFYKKFLYEPFPVESSLANQLTDHLNAEIAAGTLSKKKHCIDYLTWTYFFRRLTKNPTYYNLESNSADAINHYLRDLVNQTLMKLRSAGCIEVDSNDEESIRSTQLGYIASFYYLSYNTVSGLASVIKDNSGIAELIDILSKAEEFSGLPVRHNEDVLNEALSHLVPLPVNKHNLESPHVKANLLLQAHFDRCPLPITDFITDTKSVLDQSIRVIQGMIDIAAQKGFVKVTLNMIHLLQMVVQGQWLDQSPFINIPYFDNRTISKLHNQGLVHLVQLASYLKKGSDNEETVNRILKTAGINSFDDSQVKEITKALQRVPIVQMRWTIVGVDDLNAPMEGELLEEGGEALITVDLRRINQSSTSNVSISNFPKQKECSWFLIVVNPQTDQLIAIKRVSFKRQTKKPLTICLPADFQEEPRLQLYLMCDSYIGLDQQYTVDLNKVNQIIATKASEKSKPTNIVPKKEQVEEEEMMICTEKPHKVNVSQDDASLGLMTSFNSGQDKFLVATDGTGVDEEVSDDSFLFDVQPDDIYDLTVF